MERPTLALSRLQLEPRAARKSEWLRSALVHHHCPDLGVENEIVVLATGIDQYLQEVFHHLAYPNRDDTVSAEDFTALCVVLGLTRGKRTAKGRKGTGAEEDEEFRDVYSGLPRQLSFKDFHSRLCGYFRVRSARRGTGECAWRLPVAEDTELVERQIRLRWPRVRRRKCELTRDQHERNSSIKVGTAEDRESDVVVALRELVEDLRSALQGSDARCLALEVALRRGRSTIPSPSSFNSTALTPATSTTLVQGKLVPTRRIKGQCSRAGGDRAMKEARRRDIRDPLLRELKLIRSSRDGQLEEAIKFNECLEEELRWVYQEVRKLQGVKSALRKENAQIRRRAQEAREALSLGLQRVQMIQEEAQSVPQLQARITQLEAELQQYRSCCTCVPEPAHQQADPLGAEDACSKTECLQRAVEGRAASDEEEDDRGMREEGQCVCWRCQNHRLSSHIHLHEKNPTSRGRCSWRQQQEQPKDSRGFDKDKVSRRVPGKTVVDDLDVCSRSGDGPPQVLQVPDALCAQLSSWHLLGSGGGDEEPTIYLT
ncbi:LOW QUALITY PROTEIN: EF-hand and coiled-coil domain-containing protein 1 [Micropterus salmoides]|uniref:LOW QUALITY PROTEIN: EF-hand and coiled-coil domain-containing protein 1 n=1 Tax=Micropterus salmoides TaxID=27706 RepID=UPI0018ED7B9F|nr:LOW QUALITY PROTEIN: EF-hand and coiled-coil domain-containing protein 1 [Micropterus salmoides]